MRISASILALVTALLTCIAGIMVRAQNAEVQTTRRPAAVISLKGEIDNFSRDALVKRFQQAKAAGAKTIILKLDTAGGLVGASEDLGRFLRAQDPTETRTIAFVDRRALAAGVI